MRLYPVVPTGGIRMTKSEGTDLAGHYIPPETTIGAARYKLSGCEYFMLDESYYCMLRHSLCSY